MTIKFTVFGRPQQRGSKRALPAGGKFGGRPLMVDDNKKSGPWMAQVRAAAAQAYSGELLAGPIKLSCAFFFARPKSHYGTGKNAGVLKGNAPEFHTQTPDLAKLIRCIEDSLTGIIWRDDRQVCQYAGPFKAWTCAQERVEMTIMEL